MTLLCKCLDSTFCPTPAYIWTVVVVNDISYIYVYHVRLGRELIFNTEQKNSISFCQEKIIRQCCVAVFLTICGYFVCFWVSHQAVVLYSFFWWLRLTNFWSRTRTQAIFGQKRKNSSKDIWSIVFKPTNISTYISLCLCPGRTEKYLNFPRRKNDDCNALKQIATQFCQRCIWLDGNGKIFRSSAKIDKADFES